MTVNRRVIIIGGGFAGLAAGVRLSESGFHVNLLERRPHLGGRAYSFIDPTTGDTVDNGQHLFMGCYHQTIEFLKKIDCLDRLSFQDVPRVDFVDRDGSSSTFQCPSLPSPLHALVGLFRMSGLSLGDKFRTLRVGLAINKQRNGAGDHLTVDQWLNNLGQSDLIKQRFWYPMMIATLNENPDIASARMMKAVLRGAFGSGISGSRIGIARVGLSDLYTIKAREFIESRGGSVETSAEVKRLVIDHGSVSSVELKSGELVDADFVITAVPPGALSSLLPEAAPELTSLNHLKSSPIVSINLWLDRPVLEKDFVGLLGTHAQWAFNKNKILGTGNKNQHIAVVISAAHEFVNWTREQLVELALADLRLTLPEARSARVVHSTIVKEREATLSHTVESDRHRPKTRTSLPNLAFAGDWIDTGLPATIESAVISGHHAADEAQLYFHRGRAAP